MEEYVAMSSQFPISSIIMESLERPCSEQNLAIKALIENSLSRLNQDPEMQIKLTSYTQNILDKLEHDFLTPDEAVLIVLGICDSLFTAFLDSSDLMKRIAPLITALRYQTVLQGKPKLKLIKGGKA